LKIVLDASMALAWLFKRDDAAEASLARHGFVEASRHGATVPGIWFLELANTLLVFERVRRISEQDSTDYLKGLALLSLALDEMPVASSQRRALDLGRRYGLSAYDATYLDLAIRQSASLATFDRQLAGAARSAGVKVFGDPL
jgi:predicted nucleic acid-binding protein